MVGEPRRRSWRRAALKHKLLRRVVRDTDTRYFLSDDPTFLNLWNPERPRALDVFERVISVSISELECALIVPRRLVSKCAFDDNYKNI